MSSSQLAKLTGFPRVSAFLIVRRHLSLITGSRCTLTRAIKTLVLVKKPYVLDSFSLVGSALEDLAVAGGLVLWVMLHSTKVLVS